MRLAFRCQIELLEPIFDKQASDEFTHKGIHGDHTFCFEFAEGHVNGPLIGAGGAQAVEGQIGTFTDAHAGVANQQKGIATQIVAAAEFLLQEFILFCRKRTWESVWEARNILAADQMGEFRKLFGPSQLVEDAAQSDKQVEDRDAAPNRVNPPVLTERGPEPLWSMTAQVLG